MCPPWLQALQAVIGAPGSSLSPSVLLRHLPQRGLLLRVQAVGYTRTSLDVSFRCADRDRDLKSATNRQQLSRRLGNTGPSGRRARPKCPRASHSL